MAHSTQRGELQEWVGSIYESAEAYRELPSNADSSERICDYCNQQMAKLNVVREIKR